MNPPLVPLGPPEALIEREYVVPGTYPDEGVPESAGTTVGDVEEWHDPAPHPSVEPVLPELFANAVSGTAISKSIRKVPTIITLVFIPLSPTISRQFLYWLHQRDLSDWSDGLCNRQHSASVGNMTIPTTRALVRRYEYLWGQRGHCNSSFGECLLHRCEASLFLVSPSSSVADDFPRSFVANSR